MILYNLRTEWGPGMAPQSHRITKFDDDLNVESSYLVSPIACECPQGHKSTCRHRKMLAAMLPIVDTDEFYCYDTRMYYGAEGPGRATPKALPSLVEPKANDEVAATASPPSKLLLEPEELPRIRRRI